jgi:D-alanyl-D-alanine carboxypeptidase
MSPRRGWVVIVIAGTALAACSSDGRDGSAEVAANPTTPTPPITTTATTTTNLPPATSPPLGVDLQAALDEHRHSFGAPGAIALVRRHGDDWTGVSGDADLSGGELTASSSFSIASITKPLVAALVLDAVARGELTLDDVVDEWVPGVLRPEPPVTVRMLLDHTSGLFNIGDEGDVVADIAELTDPAQQQQATDLVARYAAGEPVILPDSIFVALAETHDRYFPPGEGFHYSNANYQLAAMVLTRAAGLPLGDLVRTRLVDPLGLRATTILPDDPGLPDMRGYALAADGSLTDLTDDLVAFGNGGSGGVVSTAGELLTMLGAIVSGRLLPSDLVAEMTTPTEQSQRSYGLGLATYYLACGTFLGHAGAVNGTQSIALVDATGDTGIVIATNLRTDDDPRLLALAETMVCARS